MNLIDAAEAPNKETVHSLSKAETAYNWVRENIISGRYTPGFRLVLSSISTELGMSVVPVREAIRQLEAEGLVTFERNVGARVAMVDENQYVHSMEVLGILEGAATAQAQPFMTEGDLQEAKTINQALKQSLDSLDPKTFTRLNHEFHTVLCYRCPNHRLLDLVSAEWEKLGHLRESTFAFVPQRAAQSVQEHKELIDLMEKGAPAEEIEKAVRAHRSATLQSYLESHSQEKK